MPALKRQIADEILVLVDGWSQAYAGFLMGVSRGRVSELRAGKLGTISLERLIQCHSRLGRTVTITTARDGRPSIHDHTLIDGRRKPP